MVIDRRQYKEVIIINKETSKSKEWIIWIVSAAVFIFFGIQFIFEKRYFIGGVYIAISIVHFASGVTKYKQKDNTNKIILSNEELEKINSEIILLIKQGDKFKAIRQYRILTRCGLKEAKEYVDSLSKI